MHMLNRWPLLLLLVSVTAAAQSHPSAAPSRQPGTAMSASATSDCPWLTRGTAANVLGGDVSLTVAVKDSQGSCAFHSQQEPAQTLEITVSAMPSQLCAKGGTRIAGVANWASECSIAQAHHGRIESIVGQARDTYFSVTLKFRASRGWQARNAELENIAEQVAGGLY